MGWGIKDNIISFSDCNGEVTYPNAEELYHQKDSDEFLYKGQRYKTIKDELGISLSMFSVDYVFEPLFKKERISLVAYAERKGKMEMLPFVLGHFVDYSIFDGRLFYVSQTINLVNEILKEEAVTDINDINYIQYMHLYAKCKELQIPLPDKVKIIDSKEEYSEKPEGLKALLYPYQEKGYNWLKFMTENECGAILADEMGLGKTIQIIALFGYVKQRKKDSKFLVGAPLSLLVNWEREITKFYPSLKTHIHNGYKRTGNYKDLLEFDVVITSYSNISSDLSMFNMIDWDLFVIDEAQNIKNPQAQRTIYAKEIKHKVGIAVTGTPFENHMTDIWSLMDFAIPNFFGTQKEFEKIYKDNIQSAEDIKEHLSPFMLRRKVNEVAEDLPPRVDISQPIEMSDEEARLYENRRRQILTSSDLRPATLGEVQTLRMFCSHPAVYDKAYSELDPTSISNKYQRLCEILEEVIDNNEKAIIFTSFNEMINIMKKDLEKRFKIKVLFINGSIEASERQNVVDEFSLINGSALLLLNPKAAGTGLNITAANHVIHYNLEWNPSLEDQASARAYRRGQKKSVFIYRLYYIKTIDEIIDKRIAMKREISSTAIIGTDGREVEKEDLIRALLESPAGGEGYGKENI